MAQRDREVVSEEQHHAIFGLFDNIYSFSETLLERLTQERLKGPLSFLQQLGAIFVEMYQLFKMFSSYIENNKSQVNAVRKAMDERDFREFISFELAVAKDKLSRLHSIQGMVSSLPKMDVPILDAVCQRFTTYLPETRGAGARRRGKGSERERERERGVSM
ncbi:MAG: hypothetical protein MHM6MM_006609 [Cercozoa sp. M6MM]